MEPVWRCKVCGYLERGAKAPALCPVCGVGPEEFERAEGAPAAERASARSWRCIDCGYIHLGDRPPAECPVCGSKADRFEEVPAPVAAAEGRGEVLILGAGIAGLAAAEAVRQAAPERPVTLVSKENELPYYRLNLTRLLAGEVTEEALRIHPRAWYDERRIGLLLGSEAVALDVERSGVALRGGSRAAYSRLILTVGARPFIPPFPGTDRENVISVRTLSDARRLLGLLRPGVRGVCIGGGALGLETAAALARRGAEVTLIEEAPWLMPRQLNRRAAEALERHIRGLGIRLHTGARTQEVVGDTRAHGVRLIDGCTIPADLVVVSAGIRTNSRLAQEAGLRVNQGVVVDNRLQSSRPDVFAAGDVAEHNGTIYGVWAPSQYQGRIAGLNAAGGQAEFGGLPRAHTLKVLGIDLTSIGLIEPMDPTYVLLEEEGEGRYARVLLHQGRIAGAVLLGYPGLAGRVKQAVESRRDVTAGRGRPSSLNALLDALA